MIAACELCGATSRRLRYTIGAYRIVTCTVCELVFVEGDTRDDALVALYDEGYWEDDASEGYDGYEAAEPRKRAHARSLLGEVGDLCQPGDLIEIGCAYGYFLDEARKEGWRVRGIEPSTHAARQARDRLSLDVENCTPETAAVPAHSADVVAMWDVIEHLPHPRATLETVRRWLRPGGIIALSTGDISSAAARLHGADWSLMTPPWHQYYFSKKTLSRLVRACGFDVVAQHGDGTFVADSASPRPKVPTPVAAVLEHSLPTSVFRRLGAGMITYLYARVPG